MKDPYNTLGVSKSASQDEIKKKYRTLARKMHPDINKDDPKAEEKFKEISQAYDILSDSEKKSMYDHGIMDENGNKTAGFGGFDPRGFGGSSAGERNAGGFDFSSIFGGMGGGGNDPFSELFGAARNPRAREQASPHAALKGDDVVYKQTISFMEAVNGADKEISLENGRKKVRIKIPVNTETGKQLRLRGQGGAPRYAGGQAGDAIIEITVAQHPYFSLDNKNVILSLPVSIKEAMLGAKIVVPTIDGKVYVTVPPNSNTGTTLRLRGKGVKYGNHRGDQLVKLQVFLPTEIDAKLEEMISKWSPKSDEEDLRKNIWK
ncbi:MAG: DnaJ domain-containing protein [Alphaproteobacteria bacterium]|nr:DnaJ domain-containing protein [Alphaproteobacteria bacterium]